MHVGPRTFDRCPFVFLFEEFVFEIRYFFDESKINEMLTIGRTVALTMGDNGHSYRYREFKLCQIGLKT